MLLSSSKDKMCGLGVDVHSHANFEVIKAKHYHIQIAADFKAKVFRGHVDIQVEKVATEVKELVLDVNQLVVTGAQLVGGSDLKFEVATPIHAHLGQPLKIDVSGVADKNFTVRVFYSTTPESAGIQWFDPEQTQGKQHPYVYTQCEAILARTLLPCQDTPAVKCPYSISVTLPAPLVAACSGTFKEGENPTKESNGDLTYHYVQKLPIPTYLIAIVAGALKKASIGPRSSVWTEAEWLDRAVYEFCSDTEEFIKAGEKLTGIPYTWGLYDVVVLPSAFPFGGMENPQLTFLSSSLLAGDRSLTNVVAHEIAHSWAGNWVSNSNWNDFWLNEGFCVYLERLILGEVFKSQEYRFFEMSIGYQDLRKTVADIGPDHEYTKLRPNLSGVDPDDAFSKIPYEKGSLFLFFLETKVGGSAAMLEWLHQYYVKYEGKSVNTETFKEEFLGWFSSRSNPQALASIDWESWLYKPGLPAFDPSEHLINSYGSACATLAEKWIKNGGAGTTPDDLKNFKSKQVMYFLDLIFAATPLSHELIDKLNNTYGLMASGNVEIAYRFFMTSLKSGLKTVFESVADFLSKHGRGLYVRPLYRALAELDRDYAYSVFKQNRSRYHGIIRNAFDKFFEQGVTIVP
jgi:leukotriene-A4 hydrolase